MAREFLRQLVDSFADRIAARLRDQAPKPPRRSAVRRHAASKSALPFIANFVAGIEWEPLANPMEVDVSSVGPASGDLGLLVVRRDVEYGLELTFEANDSAKWAASLMQATPGTFVNDLAITGKTASLEDVVVPDAVLSQRTRNLDGDGRELPATLTFDAFSVKRTSCYPAPAALLVEWFIGGPKSAIYDRLTDRSEGGSYERVRRGHHDEQVEHRFGIETPSELGSRSMGRDYLLLDLPSGAVRIARVDSAHAAVNLRPIAIEYSCEGGMPGDDLRVGVVEALGFIFGRHILKVGTTTLDASGRPVQEEANSPWGDDPLSMASRIDLPAIPLTRFASGRTPAEAAIATIVTMFLQSRDTLNLSHAVWAMWVALRMPKIFDLPLYGSALEGVMRGWFSSQRTKTGGSYMPTKDFRARFADGINEFKKAAATAPYGDRIARKVERANDMGVNERFEVFFEELKLPIDEGERAIIAARNIGAHGGKSTLTNEELAMTSNGYRTLLNRVILKAIGYADEYVDYSVVGHPARHIDAPLGYRPPPKAPTAPSGVRKS